MKYQIQDSAIDPVSKLLKNKKNIFDPIELEKAEAIALVNAYQKVILEYSESHKFTEYDICRMHSLFLEDIFDWAGTYRQVDITSPGIKWCHAQYISSEMKKFQKLLAELTPFPPTLSRFKMIERLAKLHGELIIIHPFRDGNGRLTRLFCDSLVFGRTGCFPNRAAFKENNSRLIKDYHIAIQEIWKEADYKKLESIIDLTIPQF